MRTLVRNDALLKPDRRFVLAFEDVAAFEGGRPEGGAKVAPVNRRWTIDAGNGIRAELSEIPGFFETLDALRTAAEARIPAGGSAIPERDIIRLRGLASDPFERRAFETLREIDRLWGAGADRAVVLELAARGLVTAQFALQDVLEMGDVLRGRAFAVLALAEASRKSRFGELEALLATSFGYVGEAKEFAARELPGNAPVRLYLEASDDRLRALAEDAAAPAFAKVLCAYRLASRGNASEVAAWLRTRGIAKADDSPVLGAMWHARDRFDHELHIGASLMKLGWLEAGGKDEPPGPGLLAAFERSLAGRPRETGAFRDDAVAAARARALFYGGLSIVGGHYLDNLSSGPIAEAFVDYLKDVEPGPGADFRRWFGDLTAEKNGEIRAEKLVDDITGLPSLGQAVPRRIGSRLEAALPWSSPVRPNVAAGLVRVLDSRAANDLLFALTCRSTLKHPTASERYYRAALERESMERENVQLETAFLMRDIERLKAIASDPHTEADTRVRAAAHLETFGALDRASVRAYVLPVLARRPPGDAWFTAVRLLCDYGFTREAESFLRGWLAAHRDEHVLTRASFASTLEHTLFLQGRFEDAWRAVKPYLETGQGGALWAGAEALEGLGRHEEALEMSTAALTRYPDLGWGRSSHAQILWRQRRFDEASRVLIEAPRPLDVMDWRNFVVRDFFEVFRNRRQQETEEAFDALVRSRLNGWYLFEFAEPFAKAQQYDVAIAFLDAAAKANNERIDGNLRAYRLRILRDGRESANQWFRTDVVTSRSARWIGEEAFDKREFELLWLLPDSDAHWLLRAQAAAFEGGADEARKQALVAHFRDPKTPREDALDGLFLLGLETEDRVFESAVDSGRRSDLALVLSLKAVGERRIDDACDWMRVSRRAGYPGRPSYRRADELLTLWDTHRFGLRGGADIP